MKTERTCWLLVRSLSPRSKGALKESFPLYGQGWKPEWLESGGWEQAAAGTMAQPIATYSLGAAALQFRAGRGL
jgi:hypothetical protein